MPNSLTSKASERVEALVRGRVEDGIDDDDGAHASEAARKRGVWMRAAPEAHEERDDRRRTEKVGQEEQHQHRLACGARRQTTAAASVTRTHVDAHLHEHNLTDSPALALVRARAHAHAPRASAHAHADDKTQRARSLFVDGNWLSERDKTAQNRKC
eukprot:1957940-Pleurochrysis_carterae.AAC.2